MKFNKDFNANESLGLVVNDALINAGYKLLDNEDYPTEIDSNSVCIRLDTVELYKCREIVIKLLNELGYVKQVIRSSGSKYLNFENNSKRVFYDISKNRIYSDDSDEYKEYVFIFLIFGIKQ